MAHVLAPAGRCSSSTVRPAAHGASAMTEPDAVREPPYVIVLGCSASVTPGEEPASAGETNGDSRASTRPTRMRARRCTGRERYRLRPVSTRCQDLQIAALGLLALDRHEPLLEVPQAEPAGAGALDD